MSFGEIAVEPGEVQKRRHGEQHVEVRGRLAEGGRGDVEVTVTGPSGAESVHTVPAGSGGEFVAVIPVGRETPSGIHRIVARAAAANATSPEVSVLVHGLAGVPNRVDIVSHSRSCGPESPCQRPDPMRVTQGDTVSWLNADSAVHTVAGTGDADGPSGFYSSLMAPGDSFSHAFHEAGEHEYTCTIHPWVAGTVVVEARGRPAAAAEAAPRAREARAPVPEAAPAPGPRAAEAAISAWVAGGARGPYAPGETATIVARVTGGPSVVDGRAYYEVRDPSGREIHYGGVDLDSSREARLEHAVTGAHVNGTYSYKALASVSSGRTLVAAGDFEVRVPPPAAAGGDPVEGEDAGGGGCLIATAAYGSELAPNVQRLREVRDSAVLATGAGAGFMRLASGAYYAFSPAIADAQREEPALREAVRAAVTPMVHVLGVMGHAREGSDLDVIVLGAIAIAANAAIYVVAPVAALPLARRARAMFSAMATACSQARTARAAEAATRPSARPAAASEAESAAAQEASSAMCAGAAHAPRRA
ncbi:MAG: hypothetical protein OXU37_01985 [Thaumarchaeota archaeon]|nr:hypothetical protein [Nitrososphaerota archaeon]